MKTIKSLSAIFLTAVICALSITPYFAVKTPAAPSLTVKNSSNGIKASWKKVKGATKYVLKVKKSTSSKYRTSYSGKKTSFNDDNLSPGVKYDFKVKAVAGKKSGSYSKKASLTFLDKPTLEAEELLDMKGITLTWTKVKGAKGYRIYRTLRSKNSYSKIATITSGSTNYYLDTTVKDENNPTQINVYKYYIKAYCDDTTSVKSDAKTEIYGWLNKGDPEAKPLYLTIKKGQVFKDINKKLADNNAIYLIRKWKTSDKSVVKVNNVGILTGVKKGTATVTALIVLKGKEVNIRIKTTVK